jgi:hypothetical protein
MRKVVVTPNTGYSRVAAIFHVHKKMGADEYYGQIRKHLFTKYKEV